MLYVHLVWRTWDRLPLIRPEFERQMYRIFGAEARSIRCMVIAGGGTADHVHLLVQMAPNATVSELVKLAKAVTSHWINQRYPGSMPFKWQGHFGAFSVSRWDVERITHYINRQKLHHADGTLLDELEQTDEQFPVLANE